MPRSSRQRCRASWIGRSEKENSTLSSAGSCRTLFQEGTTKTSRLPHSTTKSSPMMERPQTFNDCLVEFLHEERDERPSESELEDSKRAGGEEPLGAGAAG